MSPNSRAALPYSGSPKNVNHHFKMPPTAPSHICSTSSVVPSKRSDDDVQFVSSRPVKKQKVSQTRLQIKVTPPAPSRYLLEHQPQHHSQVVTHSSSQFSPAIVPTIQLTPAHCMEDSNHELAKKSGSPPERRVSTGMVGLPSDFHELEAASTMRGVSLPLSACLDNFVLNQPSGRARPISSPPLSPRQLPSATPISVIHDNNIPVNNSGFKGVPQYATPILENGSAAALVMTPPSSHTALTASTVIPNRPLTPTSSSSVHMTDLDKSAASMPSPSTFQAIQHYEQRPDKMTQTPPFLSQHGTTAPPAINQPTGPKTPCPACIAQKAMMARAQGFPMPMMSMQKAPTHTMPQIPCPPMHSYPPSHPQLMAMQGLNPAFNPMMMPPMQINGFNGTMPLHNGIPHHHQQPFTPSHQSPVLGSILPPMPKTIRHGEPQQSTPPTPTRRPITAPNPTGLHPALQSTHRKPARNLIVDIAETCQEKFPFEEVAERQNVPVEKVVEVFTAIIGVPLLRSANDRRRPGRVATSRIKEYHKAKQDMQHERVEAGDVRNKTIMEEIAQRLGPLEMSEDE